MNQMIFNYKNAEIFVCVMNINTEEIQSLVFNTVQDFQNSNICDKNHILLRAYVNDKRWYIESPMEFARSLY